MAESLFAADSVLDWVNAAIDAEDLAEVDQKVATLSSALDIAAEESSIRLERLVEDVSRAVPRLSYDIHFMRDSALSLQSTLSQLNQKSSASVSEKTADALERLHILDRIKRNMEAARDVLREAESWGTLEMEITSFLGEHNYPKAAERLSEASKSMVVFENTPEYDARHALMVNLQNQLEASLSSALVAAINAQDTDKCREYYVIFCNVQREPEFRNYYFGSRRASLVSLWHDVSLVDCESEAEGAKLTLAQFLPTFYEQFLALLNQEAVSIPAIFSQPALTMSSFIISVFSNIQPTFSQRLESISVHYGTSALEQVILAFKATEDFVAAVEKIMEKVKYSALLGSENNESASAQPTLNRRRSVRRSMSMTFRSGPRTSLGSGNTLQLPFLEDLENLDWDQEPLQPFVDLQVDYGMLEKKLLESSLQSYLSSANPTTGGNQARILRERMTGVIDIAEGSLLRCLSFTYGYGSVGLVQALDHHFKTFVNTLTSELLKPATVTASADVGLADLDYTPQDWSNFQNSIHLLSAARAVHERLSAFESKLRGTLVQVSGQFRLAHSDSSHTMTPSRREYQLLEQSSLNSLELQNLFNSVDPEVFQSRDQHLLPPTPGVAGYRHQQFQPNVTTPLLTDAYGAISDFAKACQTSMQSTLLSPLRQHLSSYASSTGWNAPGDPKTKKVGPNELQVPNFSFSPTDAVQRVAEGLLNLPRLFEVYAEDDALSFSLSTLPHLDTETLKGLAELTTQPETVLQPPQGHLRRPSIASTQRPSFILDTEAVASAWLTSLGNSILAYLMKDVLPNITSLSAVGAAQLSSDLGYLANIVRAINVDYEDLGRWKEWVDLENEEGKRLWNEKQTLDPVFGLVAKMRGWSK